MNFKYSVKKRTAFTIVWLLGSWKFLENKRKRWICQVQQQPFAKKAKKLLFETTRNKHDWHKINELTFRRRDDIWATITTLVTWVSWRGSLSRYHTSSKWVFQDLYLGTGSGTVVFFYIFFIFTRSGRYIFFSQWNFFLPPFVCDSLFFFSCLSVKPDDINCS